MKSMLTLIGLLVLAGNLRAGMPAFAINCSPVPNPVFSVTPAIGDFGGIQAGTSSQMTFTITNKGDSALSVKKIEIFGSSYLLTDSHTYPFEVIGSLANTNPLCNCGVTLEFTVRCIPIDYGIQTGKVVVTFGGSGDETFEIPLTGEGINCSRAIEINKGVNWAPKQDIWYKYTADRLSIIEVNSCHPHQTWIGDDYWPINMYLFSDCCGSLIAGHPEPMYENCPYDPYLESQQHVMERGETLYILWRTFPGSPHYREGFYFNFNVTYTTDGDVCGSAIPLTLPVVDHFGNTRGFNDDYNVSPCSPFVNYIGGNDKVYTITTEQEGYLKGSILGAYAGVHVLDECPKVELAKSHCKAFAGGVQGGSFTKKIMPGTYYVIVSNSTPPQWVDYLLNLSFENVSAVDNEGLTNRLAVFPNPAKDLFTVSLSLNTPADLSLELVSISGQSVYRRQCRSEYYFQEEINVARLARGVYYLKVNTGTENEVRKVILD